MVFEQSLQQLGWGPQRADPKPLASP
jgi:hypothetical protein